MKRYVCTVAAGLLLALVSTGTATASGGLPVLGDQTGTQVASFGDQEVGEQKNDADVTQSQGNGNVNIAPAIAIFGDAETTNKQGNGNEATANVDQSNTADQSQDSSQHQSLEQSGTNGCCSGQSQTGEQKTYFGDQYVGEQENDADVTQSQGNGNLNIAPAIAVGGDASTRNYQGNDNSADATVSQSNETTQSQSAKQKQYGHQKGGQKSGSCCPPPSGCSSNGCQPKQGKDWSGKDTCCDGQSQTGEQKTSFGDQSVGEQKNDADVTQKQGNWNGSFAPAFALGGGHGPCQYSKCGSSWSPHGGNVEATNKQGNGNSATANVDQSNAVEQSQRSYQRQSLVQECTKLLTT